MINSMTVALTGHSAQAATGSALLHPFPIKDNRHDPLVGLALQALHGLQEKHGVLPSSTAVIALTDSGCLSHIKRVCDGVLAMRPRQAFFARASANMLATYASLALNSHGPCFSFSGGKSALQLAYRIADRLVQAGQAESALLLAADYQDGQMQAAAVLVDVKAMQALPAILAEYEDGDPSPTAILVAALQNNLHKDES